MEDINIDSRPILKVILEACTRIFTVVFTIEVLIKWLAYGFREYFRDSWNCLDFLIASVNMLLLMFF